MIEAGLFTLLSTTPAINAIVGTRVYPDRLPTAPTLPALVYQYVGSRTKPTLSTSGLQQWRYQFDCWGADHASAAGLRDALIAALNGYQGTLNDGTILQNANFIGLIRSDFEQESLDYRLSLEFYLFFNFQN